MKGFTRDYIRALEPYQVGKVFGGLRRYAVPAEVLKKLVKEFGVPKEQWEDRQNEAPTFRELLYMDALAYEIYIVDDSRDDERITIEGVYLPQKGAEPKGEPWRRASEFHSTVWEGQKVWYYWWD